MYENFQCGIEKKNDFRHKSDQIDFVKREKNWTQFQNQKRDYIILHARTHFAHHRKSV